MALRWELVALSCLVSWLLIGPTAEAVPWKRFGTPCLIHVTYSKMAGGGWGLEGDGGCRQRGRVKGWYRRGWVLVGRRAPRRRAPQGNNRGERQR
jgi:hypothetical protein